VCQILDSTQYFTIEGISNAMDDNPQHIGAVGFQTAREMAWHVI